MLQRLAPTLTTARTEPVTLDDLFRRGDYYAVLHATLQLLTRDESTDQTLIVEDDSTRVHAALLAVKSYVALGLIEPARELLTATYSPLARINELRPLLSQLGDLPSGRIPADKLRARFDRNAPRLYDRHPHLREHDATFRGIPDTHELFWASDNNVHVSHAASGTWRRWLPGLFDHRRIVSEVRLPHNPKDPFCQPYVISGDHLGGLFRKAFVATSRMFMTFAPRIYLIEPDPTAIGLCLYLLDDIDEWCHDRVSIFTGRDCMGQYETFLREHIERSPPDYCLRLPYGEAHLTGEIVKVSQRIAKCHAEQAHAALARLRAHYDTIGLNDWAELFSRAADTKSKVTNKTRPLRILGMTSRFTTVLQYSMRDLKAAFEKLGHDFQILMEPSDHDRSTTADSATRIEAFKPDLLFLIDHHRREYPHLIPPNVPFVCWIQDRLPNLMHTDAGKSIGKLDFYIASACAELTESYQYPRSQGMTWTMATNDREYDATPLPESELTNYRCDFSYVSNQSKRPEAFHAEHCETYANNKLLKRVLDYLYERLSREIRNDPIHAPARPASELLADAQRELGLAAASSEILDRICRNYVHPLVELLFRQSTLEWVADYCDRTGRVLHIYGNGWDAHPRFAKYHRGVAVNGRPLRAIYQASRVNLQIIGSGAVHPRLLDGLAAGGFFLIRGCALDRIHEPCRRLIEAVERRSIEPDREYPMSRAPEMADLLKDIAPLLGARRSADAFRLTGAELELVRTLACKDDRGIAGSVFDGYDHIAFDTHEEFERRAEQFLADDTARAKIADRMRSVVLDRYTYSALVRDLLSFLSTRLAAAADG